ncbi:hypothetical protein V5O48_015046 [Marasmius crinis-equi]|uniref:Uncharacterized protein n=2 Tax=Marasmius crinis-equi TaxID=585013 RepID=A0ABR3EVN4_9AGAR
MVRAGLGLCGKNCGSSRPTGNATWKRHQKNEQESAVEILKAWHSRSLSNYIPDLITITSSSGNRHDPLQFDQLVCYALRYNVSRIRHLLAIGHQVWQHEHESGHNGRVVVTTGPAQIVRKWFADHCSGRIVGFPLSHHLWNDDTSRRLIARYDNILIEADTGNLFLTKENVDRLVSIFTTLEERVDDAFRADSTSREEMFKRLYLHILLLLTIIKTGVLGEMIRVNRGLERVLVEATRTVKGKRQRDTDRADDEDEEATSIRTEGGFQYVRVEVYYMTLCACYDAVAHLQRHPIQAWGLDLTVTEVWCRGPPPTKIEPGLRQEFQERISRDLENTLKYRNDPEWLARLKDTLGETLDKIFQSDHPRVPRVSYHAEASLMAIVHAYNNPDCWQHSELIRDPELFESLSEIFQKRANIMIGIPKKCCYLCWKLSKLLRTGPDSNRKIELPGYQVDGVFFPWAPPPQLSEDILKELWEDVCIRTVDALEARNPEPFRSEPPRVSDESAVRFGQ